MRFRSYDGLRFFHAAARHLSFSKAAAELNLTKGAISYQIGRLERDLGFPLFVRKHRALALTEKGRRLWHVSELAYRDLEREIDVLRDTLPSRITIGMSTYFASRWLSPRLMTFTANHPTIGLRLQPLVNLVDLQTHGIDMAIRWGRGDWADTENDLLFACPAFPTAGAKIAGRVAESVLGSVLPELTLLHDRDDSDAWQNWHSVAGLCYRPARDGLVIPDPNVRVQSVIDGQGVALNDALVATELADGRLHRLSPVALADYGYYLAYPKGSLGNPALEAFYEWLVRQTAEETPD